MLGHPGTGRRRRKTAGGGHIEDSGTIAASADNIDEELTGYRNWRCQLTHHLCSTSYFCNRFPFHAQSHQKTADLSGRGTTGHNLLHHRSHLAAIEIPTLKDTGYRLLYIHLLSAPEKVLQQVVTVLGENGFRMELHPFKGIVAVAQAHNFIHLPIFCPCPRSNLEAIR